MQDDDLDELQWVSALADGQVHTDAFTRVAAAVGRSDRARAAWHSYHVIGDALRSNDLPDCRGDHAFIARLRTRLAQQPPVPAPSIADAPESSPAVTIGTVAVARPPSTSANDTVVRWKWLAVAASMAAVAVVGWNLSGSGVGFGAGRLALSTAPGTPASVRSAAAEPQVMLRDPRLDELLAAHRRYGGASALQAPAGFLRNATFEQPAR